MEKVGLQKGTFAAQVSEMMLGKSVVFSIQKQRDVMCSTKLVEAKHCE